MAGGKALPTISAVQCWPGRERVNTFTQTLICPKCLHKQLSGFNNMNCINISRFYTIFLSDESLVCKVLDIFHVWCEVTSFLAGLPASTHYSIVRVFMILKLWSAVLVRSRRAEEGLQVYNYRHCIWLTSVIEWENGLTVQSEVWRRNSWYYCSLFMRLLRHSQNPRLLLLLLFFLLLLLRGAVKKRKQDKSGLCLTSSASLPPLRDTPNWKRKKNFWENKTIIYKHKKRVLSWKISPKKWHLALQHKVSIFPVFSLLP